MPFVRRQPVRRHSLRPIFVFVVGAFALNALADPRLQVFEALGAILTEIRLSASEEPVALDQVVDPQPLRGVSRDTFLSSWGQPDYCDGGTSESCASQPIWVYVFVRLPPGWRGNGPELKLTFDAQDLVHEVQWQFSR